MTDDLTPPPAFPMTFETANLTLRSMAGVALYIGSALKTLHRLPDRASPWDWYNIARSAAEAECCMAEALQRLARSERPKRY